MEELAIAVDKGFRVVAHLEHGIFWSGVQDDRRLEMLERRMLDAVERERDLLREREDATARRINADPAKSSLPPVARGP